MKISYDLGKCEIVNAYNELRLDWNWPIGKLRKE